MKNTIRTLFSLLVLVVLLRGAPAAAQTGSPDIGFSPAGGTYDVAAGGTQSVTATVTFSDADGLLQNTLKLTLTNGTYTTTLSGFTWTPAFENTFATARGTLSLTRAGANVFTAEIQDRTGVKSTRSVTFTLNYPHPARPVVSLAPYHNEFRDTALGAAELTYTMPSYTSLDTPRTIGLYYNSEHADPSGFVQLDVDTTAAGTNVKAVTLQIVDAVTGAAVTSEDAWGRDPSGRQRVGARWSMRDRASGAYMFWADVRAWQEDRTTSQLTRVPIRVLVINELHSRYGAGWSFAGIQRIHPSSFGLLLDEGDGTARWFEKISCVPGVSCLFRTPAGDFSRIEQHATGEYVRTLVNGTKITFSVAGVMTSVADRFGRTTRYDWVQVDSPPVWILTRITDPAQKVTWLDWLDGYLKAIIDPNTRRAELSYTGAKLTRIAGPATLEVQYDATNRVSSYTGSRGTWDVAYDERGGLRQLTAPQIAVAGGAVVRPATTFRSLQSLTVLQSWVTNICCNWAVPVPANAVLTAVTDPLGHTTSIALDRYGQPSKIIDPAGRTTEITSNEHGLPTFTGDGSRFVTYTWNDRGQLLSESMNGAVAYSATYGTGDQPEFEMTGGVATWYRYGPLGEILRSWYGLRDDELRNGTAYEYDLNYRVVAATGPTQERTEWSYAGNAWLNTSEVKVVRADGTRLVTAYTYDNAGRPHKVTNPLGQITTTYYELLNRPNKVVDALQRPTLFGYNGLDLITVTDAAGKVYRYGYNTLGWMTSETFPDGKIRRYVYDADGRTAGITDRRNAKISIVYDAAHRLTERTADGVTTRFTYPNHDTVVMTNDEAVETVSLHAEVPDRLHRIRTTIGGPSSSVAYEVERLLDRMNGWSLFGVDVKRLQGESVLRTHAMRYTRDFRPPDTTLASTLAVQDFSGRSSTIGYDASGRHKKTVYPNGVAQQHWYTSDGRLSATTYNNSSVNLALAADYTYDVLGRISTRLAATGTTRWSYGYDALGQLSMHQRAQLKTADWCNPSFETCDTFWELDRLEGYTYDAAGNRTDSGAPVQPGSNRYAAFDGYTLEYDAEGNTTRKAKPGFEQTLAWNTLGRLTSVTTNGVTVTYGYAPSGRRIRRTEGGQAVYFIYDDDDLVMEVDAQGNPLRSYTNLPGIDQPLSVATHNGGQENVHYYTTEAPGHVTGVLDISGGVTSQYRYEPFGEIESAVGNHAQTLRFMARELDRTTGYSYVRNRWYDPTLARFVSEDPIGLVGGINQYAYAGNEPMNRRDPSGLRACFRLVWLGLEVPVCFDVPTFGEAFGNSRRTYGLTRGTIFDIELIKPTEYKVTDFTSDAVPLEVGPPPLAADCDPSWNADLQSGMWVSLTQRSVWSEGMLARSAIGRAAVPRPCR